jgi:glucosylceramidase
MKAKQILTDKNHYMTELEIFPALMVSRANTLNIETNVNENFKGFGVAITGSSCYNLSIMEKNERKELLNKIYSDNGIGLSVGRLSIGPSDYSAEVYSYDDEPFDVELKHFSIERDKKYIIPMIKEILKIKPDLFLFASPWSPPGWMKTGGNMCGGYMREEFVECYADYIIKFLKAYDENGIKISAITPQNEPNTQQAGQMPGCIWHPEIEAKFIKILRKRLDEEKLDVKIWMYDDSFADADRVLWQLDNYKALKDSCDAVAFHYYSGTIEETLKVKRAYPEKELHFTEAGPRLYDNYDTDWCKWGIMISKAIKCGYSSFTGWNLMLNEMGGPNVGPFLCGGLVTLNTNDGEISFSGQYKAFSHIAKYINENSKIYPVYVGEEYDLPMVAYPKANMDIEGFCIDNNDGKNVLILINPNTEKRQIQFNLNDTWWYAELTPESISTIIIE